jgi:hypothetical protein
VEGRRFHELGVPCSPEVEGALGAAAEAVLDVARGCGIAVDGVPDAVTRPAESARLAWRT